MAERTVYIIDVDDRVRGRLRGVQQEARRTDNVFDALGGKLAKVFAGISVAKVATDIVQTTAKFQSLSNAIKFSSDNAIQGQQSLAWLENFSGKYGLGLEAATEGFKTFQGAMMNTKFTSNQVRTMFEGVSKGVVTMGLSTEDAKGTFLALGQIMGKGKVQAEELRGQIGERIPGAFSIAARAMNMSTAELDKFMADGKLMAEDFLPKFSAEMEKTFGPGATEASDSLASSLNRLSSSWDNLMKSIGNSDSQGIMGSTFNFLSDRLNSIADDYKSIDEITQRAAQADASKRIGNSEYQISHIAASKDIDKATKEKYIKDYTVNSLDILNKELAGVNRKIGEQVDSHGLGGGETFQGETGLAGLKKHVDWVRVAGGAEQQDVDAYNLLVKQKELMTVISGITAASDKTIGALYAKSNFPEGGKAKKKSAGGITLNESKNGATNITFNIDTFQKNEFSSEADKVGASAKSAVEMLKLGLVTVVNDSQIAAGR